VQQKVSVVSAVCLPKDKGGMSSKMFFGIVDELHDIGHRGCRYQIGLHMYNEPLADVRLTEFVRYTRGKFPNAGIYIHTNGDLLTPELFSDLLDAGLTRMRINQYDGATSKHVTAITDGVERSIARVKSFRRQSICNRAGALRKIGKPFVRMCKKAHQCVINWRGDLILCCNDYFGKISPGNVTDKSVLELWNDPMLQHYRDELANGCRAKLPLCRECNIRGGNPELRKKGRR